MNGRHASCVPTVEIIGWIEYMLLRGKLCTTSIFEISTREEWTGLAIAYFLTFLIGTTGRVIGSLGSRGRRMRAI